MPGAIGPIDSEFAPITATVAGSSTVDRIGGAERIIAGSSDKSGECGQIPVVKMYICVKPGVV